MDSDSQGAFSESTGTASSNPKLVPSVVSISPVAYKLPEIHDPSHKGVGGFPPAYQALLISALVAAGSYSILPIWLYMCRLWINDPLRAIGAVFPLLAFVGILAAWRRIGWSMKGSFWALLLIALTLLTVLISTSSLVDFQFHHQTELALHPGLIMFLYGVGAVLLFGGTRLLRASIAPLCLLLFINPVPHFFNTLVDLPLQFLSANTARHFAHLIGLQPTGEQLRMMFTPDFGMMIVPGCNGVRGSVTLGYLALIFGYIRHLRWRALTFTTLGAFLMGYALNLLRLCTLVIYYRIGITHPSIQPYGANVDYGIGGTLFLFATLGVGLFIRWIEPKPEELKNDAAEEGEKFAPLALRPVYATAARVFCFLILTLIFIVPKIGRGQSFRVAPPDEQTMLSSFPTQVGSYRLIRTYAERDNTGSMRFAMADYSTAQNGSEPDNKLTLGIFVGSGMHMVAYSRFTQGVSPDWTGSFDALDTSVQPPLKVRYATSFYDDGIRREYNAESACYESGCSASIASASKKFFWSAPTFSSFFFASEGNRLTILLRREWLDSDTRPNEILRSQFEADAQQFTKQLNLRALLHADGAPVQF